jgi:hypothetical protein
METRVLKETLVLKVLKETPDPLVPKGLKETRVHKVHSVHWGIKQIPAAPVIRAIPVRPVPKVRMEMRVVAVLKAIRVLRAIPEQQGLMGRKVQLDALVRRVTPVLTPILETRVPKVPLVQSVLKEILVPRVLMV